MYCSSPSTTLQQQQQQQRCDASINAMRQVRMHAAVTCGAAATAAATHVLSSLCCCTSCCCCLLCKTWSAVLLLGHAADPITDAAAASCTPFRTHAPVEIIRQHVAVSVAPASCTALGNACAVLYGVIQCAHVLVLAQHLLRVAPALLEGAVCPAVPVLCGLFRTHACRNLFEAPAAEQ
jgi:hypothetical protein